MSGESPLAPAATSSPAKPAPAPAQGMLSVPEIAKVREWVVQKWGNGKAEALPPCPMCKQDSISWIGPVSMYTPISLDDRNIFLNGPIMPLLPIMCSNCGNTVLVNGILAGIMSTSGERLLKPDTEKSNG